MSHNAKSDEAIVEGARRVLVNRRKHRWEMLVCGLSFISLCVFYTSVVLRRLAQEPGQMTVGFFAGVFLGLIGLLFGLLGAIAVARSVVGFQGHLRSHELLVIYHDRLRDMKALPDGAEGKGGSA